MAPHTPGVLRFGKLSKKPVAPAGYKNKQCRKQTSVLSGRIVTAYVPLRSATERERAAFLIPCQGLRGFDSISLLTFNLAIASHSLIDQSPTPAMPPPNKKEQYYTRDLYIRSISSHEIVRSRGRLHRYTINVV